MTTTAHGSVIRFALRRVAVVVTLLACTRGEAKDARAARAGGAPAGDTAAGDTTTGHALPPAADVRDSALAIALARFREGLPPVDTLLHAASSRDALVRRFIEHLAIADTGSLARLHLSRREWAWLAYPESRYVRPPYRHPPDIAWMLLIERSNSGLGRALARRGGQPLRLVRWTCPDAGEAEGRTRYWGGCTVTYRDARGVMATERLFGSIVERDGRFKFASYANQF